jgi:Kdo2-lipid IVA lauroyltransferase/acyltransferase
MLTKPHFHRRLLHPRHWLLWLGLGAWWLIAQWPYAWQMALGAALGRLMGRLAPRRAAIAARNIALCFPELSALQQADLLAQTLDSIGKAFFETGIAWFLPHRRFARLIQVEGLEHLQQAAQEGQGVILLAMHFTHLDLGAAAISYHHSIDGTYRPHANPVYDYVQRKGRERHNDTGSVITRGDIRGMIRALKKGRAVWYAPDQDYGRDHSVFVPFFGVPAATITATAQLARLGHAQVIPFVHERLASGAGYRIRVLPALEAYPSGDDLADAARINRLIEDAVRQVPGQYLWVHRRFKTRPDGEPDLYQTAGIGKGTRT